MQKEYILAKILVYVLMAVIFIASGYFLAEQFAEAAFAEVR